MTVPSTLRSILPGLAVVALAAPSLSGCASGCGDQDEDFPRIGERVDPDDDTADDDTSTPAPPVPPVIEVVAVNPAQPPFAGTLTLTYRLTDADSSSFRVATTFGVDGAASTFLPASLTNATQPPNIVAVDNVDGAPPIDGYEGELVWDTVTDIPTATASGVLQLCPIDGEGNEGACVLWPEDANLVVQNTLESGLGAFCQPGHLEYMTWLTGDAIVPLSDESCLNYKDSNPEQPDDFSAQFMLVLVNPNDAPVGFQISQSEEPPIPEPSSSAATRAQRPTTPQRIQRKARMFQSGACVPALSDADLHADPVNFYFRTDISLYTEDNERLTRAANLRALGEHVAVYVDEETPIDIDTDCADPQNAIQHSPVGPAFGFNNCALEEVVEVFDANIYPTVTNLYGEPSDVDQDCRVTVFLSHRLNGLTETNASTNDDTFIVKSFVEPEVDLWLNDSVVNPGSNQAEMLYVFAPDPVALWSGHAVQLEDYLNYDLAGRLAVSLADLVQYGAHREVTDRPLDPSSPDDLAHPAAEADWLNDGLSLLAADLTGFGATVYPDAWIYMDRSYLLPLVSNNTLESFQDRGGQYLFARYLYDLLGPAAVTDLVNAETTGVDSITALIADEAPSFDDFLLQWAIAMTVSGRDQGDVNHTPLVPDTEVPNYKVSSTVVVANPEAPQPGELYGANGFQQGYNIRGFNRTYVDGTNPLGPVELSALLYKTENLDPLVLHPQAPFFGHVQGDFSVLTILVSGLEQETNYLYIQAEGGRDLIGAVVRVEDTRPKNQRLILEGVDGPILTTVVDLGELDVNGAERNVIGRVDGPNALDVNSSLDAPEPGDDDSAGGPPQGDDDDDDAAGDDDDDSAAEETGVNDVDRFGFRISGQAQLVGIWLDRRFSNVEGAAGLADPFLAVVRAEDVPDIFDYDQWNFGPGAPISGPYVCADPDLFLFPIELMDWTYAQGVLIPEPSVEGFDNFMSDLAAPPGPQPLFTCEFDHDQNGIADSEEPSPQTLAEQIGLRQFRNLSANSAAYQGTFELLPPPYTLDVTEPYFGASFIDYDSNEDPDDDLATAYPFANIGGRAVDQGEEAVWLGMLPPGDYVILVGGASGAEGPYDLSIRVVTNAP